ncbi:STAS domain-containing protein [Streptomyces sp. NPDC060194]|uniref:STAS domain-containing protein n=1 Tax=Streptomyces sp. NPDC060194 TaxID=3347069 RepID=UPI00365C10D3
MTKTPHLTVEIAEEERGTLVTVAGDLDYDSSPRLQAALDGLRLGADRVLVLDLAGLTFFDSSGVTVLIVARKLALAAGASIAVSALTPMVAKIFRITGLDQVFPCYPDAGAALAHPPADA